MDHSKRTMSEELLKRMQDEDKVRAMRRQKGIPALIRLSKIAQGGGGQSHYVRRFLLGLYNGSAWPMDLTSLRALDTELQAAVLDVIELDWCGNEIHTYLNNGDDLFQAWWEQEAD